MLRNDYVAIAPKGLKNRIEARVLSNLYGDLSNLIFYLRDECA